MSRKSWRPVTLGSSTFRTLDVGIATVTLAHFPGALTLHPHTHERAVVGVTLSGTFDSVMRGRAYRCQPSGIHTEPAGERHANHFDAGGARVIVIQPDPAHTELIHPCKRLLEEISQFRDDAIAALGRRLDVELSAPDELTPLAVEALAMETLAVAARLPGDRHPMPPIWLSRARELIHASFLPRAASRGLGGLRLRDVAAAAGVHPSHLTRAFRRYFGESLGEYARRLRIDWAATELWRTDDAISDIALEAGFSDQSHFTRAFRRAYGRTPAGYRRERELRRRIAAPLPPPPSDSQL